jgi:peroxiredoxin
MAVDVGDLAPAFTRPNLTGQPQRLADFRGKLVLLNFWATWCGPCRKEMPLFSTWQGAYGPKGLQIIGVSMDEETTEVHEFITRRPVSYPILLGDAKLGDEFGGVLALPLTFLIDAQGRVVARYQGESDLAKMEAKIKETLSRKK